MPRLAAVLVGVSGRVLAPRCCRICLCQNDLVGHLIGPLRFTQVFCRLRLDDEIRFIGLFVAVMNLKVTLGGFEPFQNVFVVLQNHRKAAFWIRVEFLDWVQALAEPSENHSADAVTLTFGYCMRKLRTSSSAAAE